MSMRLAPGVRRGPWRRFGQSGPPMPADGAAPLVAAHRAVFPKADAGLLVRAYAAAAAWHSGQTRKSGEPYVTHPLAVATILAHAGMDTGTVVAALLHDTVEDTDLTLEQVAGGFGPDVARLVDGVTKLDGSRWGKAVAEAETYRRMLVAADDDLRVLVIKIADRLHNMRTLGGHPRVEKRQSVARQSLHLLVPLARRLGLYVFVREMEDIALSVLEPAAYARVRDLVSSSASARDAEMRRMGGSIREALTSGRIPARVTVRPRHLSSIREALGGAAGDENEWRALQPGDAERITVIVDGPPEACYEAMGVLHGRWLPTPGRFRDYIAMPAHNLYRALHTTLHMGNGTAVSVMIRTPEMDQVAEYGIAAQIRAAAGRTGQADLDAIQRVDRDWLRSILDWQLLSDSDHFLDDARTELAADGIVTYTQEGKALRLPPGATGIDFAYAVSAETGRGAAGVSVDGRLQPLAAPLRDGQAVTVIKSEFPDEPTDSWLQWARTPRARAHIRSAIEGRRADEAEQAGRDAVRDALAGAGLDLLDSELDGTALHVCRRLGYRDLYAAYTAVGDGDADAGKMAAMLAAGQAAGMPSEIFPMGPELAENES